MARSAFTLIEVLVSILIFLVASSAMIGILMLATNLFRRGEYSRAANDETVAVLGGLNDDFKRLVPGTDGGWVFSTILPGDGAGNCVVAFVITNPDPSAVTASGDQGRLLVAWWVDGQGNLLRQVGDLVITPADPIGKASKDQLLNAVNGNNGKVVTTGCLHFGAWLALQDEADYRRFRDATTGIDWEKSNTGGSGYTTFPGPWRDSSGNIIDYDTDGPMPLLPSQNWPFPTAMRLSLTLTGGSRFAPHGFLISDLTKADTSFRIAGVGALPTVPGSVLRIGDEWIAYTGYAGGRVTCATTGRGARRSLAAAHARNDEVKLGQTYSLVRALPR